MWLAYLYRHPREGGGPVTFADNPQTDRSAPQVLDSRLRGNDVSTRHLKSSCSAAAKALPYPYRHPREGGGPVSFADI